MHITLVISSLEAGGAEKVLIQLANHLSKKYNITIICFSNSNQISFYKISPNIGITYLNILKQSHSLVEKIKNLFERVIKLRAAIKRQSPDIVISFMDITNITSLLAARNLGIQVIVSERTNPFFHTIPKFYNILRRWIYPNATRVVVQNQSASRYFSKQKNITIIPNPVSAITLQKAVISKVVNIISIGRLDKGKDHSTLIKAFAKVSSQYPKLKLTIYGEGPERNNIENLICSLTLQEKVFLPGTVKNVQDYLLRADLFVFPSRYEGFPNALCEAMAVGLPVIASNCSGNIDIIEDRVNGRIFPIGDVDKLEQIMLELIKDLPQRQRLSKKAVEISGTYSPEKIYKLWDDLISNISEKI